MVLGWAVTQTLGNAQSVSLGDFLIYVLVRLISPNAARNICWAAVFVSVLLGIAGCIFLRVSGKQIDVRNADFLVDPFIMALVGTGVCSFIGTLGIESNQFLIGCIIAAPGGYCLNSLQKLLLICRRNGSLEVPCRMSQPVSEIERVALHLLGFLLLLLSIFEALAQLADYSKHQYHLHYNRSACVWLA